MPFKRSLVLFTALVAVGSAESGHDDLIGRWRSAEVSPAGISSIFEFHSDNELDTYSAAISESKYRLIGTDTILLQSGKREEKQELEWDNKDRARIEDEAAGKSIELTRVAPQHGDKALADPSNALVGEWATVREWNGKKYPARALFFPDGRVLWIATLQAAHGHYSLPANNIRIEVPGRPVVAGGFVIHDNRLTLPNPRGGDFSFDRF